MLPLPSIVVWTAAYVPAGHHFVTKQPLHGLRSCVTTSQATFVYREQLMLQQQQEEEWHRLILAWRSLQRRAIPASMTAAVLLVPRAVFATTRAVVPAKGVLWTIPLVAGLLNWATNRLAILMMFYPLKFRGIVFERTPIGWHGIVPNKALSMANRIVDDVMLRLIDIRTVFARLPADEIATALEPTVVRIGVELATDLADRQGWGSTARLAIGSGAFNSTLKRQGHALVADFVRDVQADPNAVFDLREIVVRGVADDPKVLVDLFERCGRDDLRFVVNSGLVLGGALGVLQMLLWLVWSPWWSLALTGAAVGMVTDQLALKLIFEPVEPRMLGPLKLQGLFLQRQAEVSAEFADFMAANVLTAPQLWRELLSGSRSSAFWRMLSLRVDAALGVTGSAGLPNLLGLGLYNVIGKEVRPRRGRP